MRDGLACWRRVVGAVAAAPAIWVAACSEPPPTTSALSPDGSVVASLVEISSFGDRNFTIQLTDVASQRSRMIFESPDEGRPVGTERFIWSADGSRLLLLGQNFFITQQGILASGEQAYLMMDLPSGRIWCNASQQGEHPGFGLPELLSIEWLGWTPE